MEIIPMDKKTPNQFDKYMPFTDFDSVRTYMKSIEKIDLADPAIHGKEAYKKFALAIANCVTRMEHLQLSDKEIEEFGVLFRELVSNKDGIYDSTAILNNNKMSSFSYCIGSDDAKNQGLPDYALDYIMLIAKRKGDSFRRSLQLLAENNYCNGYLNNWYYANGFGPAFEIKDNEDENNEGFKQLLNQGVEMGPFAPTQEQKPNTLS